MELVRRSRAAAALSHVSRAKAEVVELVHEVHAFALMGSSEVGTMHAAGAAGAGSLFCCSRQRAKGEGTGIIAHANDSISCRIDPDGIIPERLSEGLKRALCLVQPACLYRPEIASERGLHKGKGKIQNHLHSASNGDRSFQDVAVIKVPIFSNPNYGNNLRPTIYFTDITDFV
jgi:hypothetical protein